MQAQRFRVRSTCSHSVIVVDARSTRSFARHEHGEYGIGLITAGAQRSGSGRGTVEAGRGSMITVNPAELHDGQPIGSTRSRTMLYLSTELVADTVADIDEGQTSPREFERPVMHDVRLARLFLTVRDAALDPHGQGAFAERSLALLANLFSPRRPMGGLPVGRLSRVRELIDDAPAEHHTLAKLATVAGLSRYQTIRGFSRLTGMTPHAYLTQRRLDMVRRMIRLGMPLVDAALDAGFADQSHMHRVFVARHGYTPGAYAAAFQPPCRNFVQER